MPLGLLTGECVSLRPLKRSDQVAIQKYANDWHVARYLPLMPFPYTLDHARQWINTTHRAARNKTEYDLGIHLTGKDEIIGMVSLMNLNWKSRNAELGYWMARKYWGKGYMREAISLILRYAFKELRLVRVYAVVLDTNIPSVKVLERVGFTREGTWRKADKFAGRWHDVFGYGILKEEFRFR
jgi:RimJ/RimL family protein N-acetyltransferase